MFEKLKNNYGNIFKPTTEEILKIKELELKVEELQMLVEYSYIGEVYCSREIDRAGTRFYKANQFNMSASFAQFKQSDITDQVDNNIKIFNIWFNKKDVIFYKDIYNTQRKTIENRYKK